MKIDGSCFNWRKLIINDRELSFGAKSMGLYLSTMMNDHQDMAWPSLERIKYEMKLGSKNTVLKYLKELEKEGYIKCQKRFHNSTIYIAKTPEKILNQSTEFELSLEEVKVQNLTSQSSDFGIRVVHEVNPNNQCNNQENNQEDARGKTSSKSSPCPYQKIVDLYHEKLPMCPKVVTLTDARKRSMSARWRNGAHGLDFWEAYFDHVAQSRFLTGRVDPPPGRKQFVADIDFLIREATIVKMQEGKYDG